MELCLDLQWHNYCQLTPTPAQLLQPQQHFFVFNSYLLHRIVRENRGAELCLDLHWHNNCQVRPTSAQLQKLLLQQQPQQQIFVFNPYLLHRIVRGNMGAELCLDLQWHNDCQLRPTSAQLQQPQQQNNKCLFLILTFYIELWDGAWGGHFSWTLNDKMSPTLSQPHHSNHYRSNSCCSYLLHRIVRASKMEVQDQDQVHFSTSFSLFLPLADPF